MDIGALQDAFGALLDRGADYLGSVPWEIVLVGIALPLLVAIASGRLLVMLGTAIFLILTAVVLTRPSLAVPAIASVMWVTGMVMAGAAISSRRSHRALKAQLDTLQMELGQIYARESQRYMAALRHDNAATATNGKPADNAAS